jgi:FKBP-type peptidyl-prolyl cis-trans isomerase SlyD
LIAEQGKVVSIDYTLTNSDGKILDTSEGREPLAYLHGGGNIIPGLESAIDGKSAGDQLTVVIEPEQAYGLRDEAQVGKVPRSHLEGVGELSVGTQLQAETPEGPRIVVVADMDEESVTIDANHPLAGETLHFDVTVSEVRDPTPEEIEHGHAHDAGGHPH